MDKLKKAIERFVTEDLNGHGNNTVHPEDGGFSGSLDRAEIEYLAENIANDTVAFIRLDL
jgi:hypothetical protein